MSAPQVLKHGEHANQHYAPAVGQKQSWAGKSTDAERKGAYGSPNKAQAPAAK